ncbi:MAG: 5'-deoxynucleotidase [Ruminococcus sp.]|nr:5'-deoxynucleotidase [Ruminococcus sp.]
MDSQYNSHFFAMLSRMKYISRWGLMNNTKSENISEHSLQTAMFAHLLVLLHNKRSGEKLNAERAALIAVYHDATEIITGDMPTPVKYYNPEIIESYKKVEKIAGEKLVSMLPEDLRDDYSELILLTNPDDEPLAKYVKAADKLSALVKCIEEIRMGNDEFKQAKESTEKALRAMKLPEADEFMDVYLPSFSLTLDEQNS